MKCPLRDSSTRFVISGFFHESTPYSPRIHTLKYFWILFRIRRNIRFSMLFWWGLIPSRTLFQGGLIPRRTLLSGVSDPAEQVYAIKCSQLCHCSAGSDNPARLGSAGSDTPQGLVLRGLIPRRILFCGVSDPAGKLRPPQNQTKKFSELAILFKGTLFENCLDV